MEKLTLKDLAIQHSYYASPVNYYDNNAGGNFKNWEAFYKEYHDADIDMNLIYRWDIEKPEDAENYQMKITIIGQHKGIYIPIFIELIEEKDVEQIVEFLKPHFEKLLEIWNPLSTKFIK